MVRRRATLEERFQVTSIVSKRLANCIGRRSVSEWLETGLCLAIDLEEGRAGGFLDLPGKTKGEGIEDRAVGHHGTRGCAGVIVGAMRRLAPIIYV
ncbi:MAG: hypothetical protein PVF85_07610 [Anaerolineales bacterium]|jgi:hypothetical protein